MSTLAMPGANTTALPSNATDAAASDSTNSNKTTPSGGRRMLLQSRASPVIDYWGATNSNTDWPCNAISTLVGEQCDASSCADSWQLQGITEFNYAYCDGGFGAYNALYGQAYGSFAYGGSATLWDMLSAMLQTQGGQCGSWWYPYEWYMPTNIVATQNVYNLGWDNLSLAFTGVCVDSQNDAPEGSEILADLGWEAILALFFL